MSRLTRILTVALGALALLVAPAQAARNGDLGSTDQAQGSLYGLPGTGNLSGAPQRDTAGNLIENTGPVTVPSEESIFQSSRSAAIGGRYDPDSWVTEVLRNNPYSGNRPVYRPTVNHRVGTQLRNTSRVASSLVPRGGPGAQQQGGGSDWTDLARVLTQIFNGWDA